MCSRLMESYQLRWEVFGDQFLKSLKKESRLQEFADVSVAVSDGEVVQAHKLVLASSSSFFRKVLKAAPHPYPLIYIPGVTMQKLKALLKYMYTGDTGGTLDGLHWMQDGAPPHASDLNIQYLARQFGGRLLARRSEPYGGRDWAARSPDLNPLDYGF